MFTLHHAAQPCITITITTTTTTTTTNNTTTTTTATTNNDIINDHNDNNDIDTTTTTTANNSNNTNHTNNNVNNANNDIHNNATTANDNNDNNNNDNNNDNTNYGETGGKRARVRSCSTPARIIVAIFYPFSQFCEIYVSLLSLQKQPETAPNLFQRGVEYGKYVIRHDLTWPDLA